MRPSQHASVLQLTLSPGHYVYVAVVDGAPFEARVATPGRDIKVRRQLLASTFDANLGLMRVDAGGRMPQRGCCGQCTQTAQWGP